MIHHQWMSSPEHHQTILYAAIGDAIASDDAPQFMTPDKEAMALIAQMRLVDAALRDGFCPLVKLMALSQQALRCAACGYAQGEARDAVVDGLLAKTRPS